ncbi:MAG: Flp pilus assembly complex ATPase component TadA [Nitrospirae bacterium]|nr:Flp pilus assembly complex ATPase component TadA [Nitrospirota bacterium]
MNITISYLGTILLKKGLLTEEQYKDLLVKSERQRAKLQNLLDIANSKRVHPDTTAITAPEIIASFDLVISGTTDRVLNEDTIMEALAEELKMEYRRIDPLKLNMDFVTKLVPRPFALKHLIVPLEQRDGVYILAVADPFNKTVIDNLELTKKIKIKPVLAAKGDILKTIREFFGFRASVIAAEAETTNAIDVGNLEQFVQLKGQGEIDASDSHIINAVEHLLNYAFEQRASDIHIEPKREKSFIRFRIDGHLHLIHTLPKKIHPPIISRIKMLSHMDISEKRRPQDGRIKTNHKNKEIELRVSTMPVAFGEKIVIRIFDPDILLTEIDKLGFEEREGRLYNGFLMRPNGIILVTGPTGSGKTTTLYSSLKKLSTPEVNIVTVEDPIEMVLEEFNQVGVRAAIDVTFGNILKTILRQDPDIIMIGEIRDKETAENAVQAALTGHLVLSTIHTNDAPSTITRLIDIGVPSFLLSSTIIGIIAQRLVRKICTQCKTQIQLTQTQISGLLLKENNYTVWHGKGCKECRGTGYKGRLGVFEIIEFTEELKAKVTDKVELSILYPICRAQGMVSLKEGAIKKMLDGITTYEEVIAITG